MIFKLSLQPKNSDFGKATFLIKKEEGKEFEIIEKEIKGGGNPNFNYGFIVVTITDLEKKKYENDRLGVMYGTVHEIFNYMNDISKFPAATLEADAIFNSFDSIAESDYGKKPVLVIFSTDTRTRSNIIKSSKLYKTMKLTESKTVALLLNIPDNTKIVEILEATEKDDESGTYKSIPVDYSW